MLCRREGFILKYRERLIQKWVRMRLIKKGGDSIVEVSLSKFQDFGMFL